MAGGTWGTISSSQKGLYTLMQWASRVIRSQNSKLKGCQVLQKQRLILYCLYLEVIWSSLEIFYPWCQKSKALRGKKNSGHFPCKQEFCPWHTRGFLWGTDLYTALLTKKIQTSSVLSCTLLPALKIHSTQDSFTATFTVGFFSFLSKPPNPGISVCGHFLNRYFFEKLCDIFL